MLAARDLFNPTPLIFILFSKFIIGCPIRAMKAAIMMLMIMDEKYHPMKKIAVQTAMMMMYLASLFIFSIIIPSKIVIFCIFVSI